MIDDIVTRLRGLVSIPQIGRPDMLVQGIEICIEAADEIERLRWELELATKWRDNYKLEIERLQEELTRIDTALKTVLAITSEAVYGE